MGTLDGDVRRERRLLRLFGASRSLFSLIFPGSSSCFCGLPPDGHDKDTANSLMSLPAHICSTRVGRRLWRSTSAAYGLARGDHRRSPSTVLDEIYRARVLGVLLGGDLESVLDAFDPASRRHVAGSGYLVSLQLGGEAPGGIADVLLAGSCLPGLKVPEDRLDVVVEPRGVFVTHGPELGNDRVSPWCLHGRALPVCRTCK